MNAYMHVWMYTYQEIEWLAEDSSPLPCHPPPFSCVQAGRASRKEKINAWHLNECGECWIDRNSKLGQQDCLFKGQDPLIIVLAEIDSQAHSFFTNPLLSSSQLGPTVTFSPLFDCLCDSLQDNSKKFLPIPVNFLLRSGA